MAFLSFFAFLKTCTPLSTPRVFAVKGGSHPGKNPPIYTVLNAAFSCVKTLCRGGHSARLVHDPAERQIFFRKNIFYSSREILSSTRFLKKIFKKIFFVFEKIFLEKYFYKKNFLEKKIFYFQVKVKLFFYLNKIYFYKKFFKKKVVIKILFL